jgi:FkbM family methyltransferase
MWWCLRFIIGCLLIGSILRLISDAVQSRAVVSKSGRDILSTESHACLTIPAAFEIIASMYHTNIRPSVFFMRTSAFKAVFYGVPGDEMTWRKLENQYSWKGTTATLVFVGELFRRAKSKGYGNIASNGLVSPTLIDIGGNMGQEAVVAGIYGFSSRTFELLPRSVDTIRLNLALNCISEEINAVEMAGVGKESEEIRIDTSGFTAGKAVEKGNSTDYLAKIWSMDDFFLRQEKTRMSGRPLLYKIDCEGCEANAILGSLEMFQKFPPHYILLEYSQYSNINVSVVERLWVEFGYSRVLLVAEGDEWIKDENMSNSEPRIFRPARLSLEKGRRICEKYCDLLFIHDRAFDLGFSN